MKRVVDLRQGRVFSHKAIQQKKDGRSNRQASGTGVTPDDGSPMLKLAKKRKWDFAQSFDVGLCANYRGDDMCPRL
ncbi:unnamed protein product [Prunus armeniaca]